MPEAEDVLIHAAERATHAVRRLWSAPATGAAPRPHPTATLRRIGLWLVACLGREWPLLPDESAAPASRIAAHVRRLAPWQAHPTPAAWSDGAEIHLPRPWLETPGDALHEAALIAALSLGTRISTGGSRASPRWPDPVSDLLAAAEAARADAVLARALPGLRRTIEALRLHALAARPRQDALRPAEAQVEAVLATLLAAPVGPLPPALRPLTDRREAQAFAHALLEALPARERDRYRGAAPVAHWGRLVAAPTTGTLPEAASTAPPARLPARPLRGPVRPRALDPDEREGRPGPFVLPFSDPHLSVEDARSLVRPIDQGDEPELDALAEEVARQDELPRVRGGPPAREVLEGGPPRAGQTPRSVSASRHGVVYPEWDAHRGGYRNPGCIVYEQPAPEAGADWARRALARRGLVLERLRRRFEPPQPRRERLGRQLEGDQLDVDGWVDDYAARCAGGTPSGRLYALDRPRRRDVSVALLLDASASTDGQVSQAERVIDVEKVAALCCCGALSALGDRHAVYAFSTQGPGDVRVVVAKRFDEPGSPAVHARIGGLEPDGGTRLGAAVRHVTAALAREPSRSRLLVLLSDGKPHDDDAYAGPYGLADVRRAVLEARAQQIALFCVTVDHAGHAYLPRLFGTDGYTVLRDAEELPDRLPRIAWRLTRS